MTRQVIGDWKRKCAKGNAPGAAPDEAALARQSALALLGRSVKFGHRRLAIVRLVDALGTGADVPAAYWDHCRRAVRTTQDVDHVAAIHCPRHFLCGPRWA